MLFHPNDVYLDENFQPWDVVSVLFFIFLDDFEIQCTVYNMVYTMPEIIDPLWTLY